MPRRPAKIEQSAESRRRTGRLAVGLATLVVCVAGLGTGTAVAANPIEGVWSFNAGKIAIQAGPGGTFSGTVVDPTKFTQCTHPVGEEVWSEMREQADGSYWGLHRWYFATEECIPNPSLGLTAWRVLTSSSGAHFLRVCFSEPGSTSQPTIAPNGTAAHDTFGCSDSALVSALPTVTQKDVGRYLRLPGNGTCVRRAKLTIRIRDPENDPFVDLAVTLRSGAVHRTAKLSHRKRTTVAKLSLRGISSASFTVTVRATTALGEHLVRKRTYSVCARKHHGHRRHRR